MYNYELYHHGILGQKWGVRRFQNKDGSLTAAGQKRYADNIKDAYNNSFKNNRTYAEGVKIRTDAVESIPGYKKAIAEIDELYDVKQKALEAKISKFAKEYDDSSEYYTALSGIVTMNGWNPSTKMGDISDSIWFNTYEDGDQGPTSSSVLFAVDKNKAEEAVNLAKEAGEIFEAKKNAVKKYVDETLGEHANDLVSSYTLGNKEYKTYVKDAVANTEINYRNSIDKIKGIYPVQDAADYYGMNKTSSKPIDYKKEIAEAKKVIDYIDKRINASHDRSGWDRFDQAIDVLGMRDKNYRELSSSDWDRINAKMRELNKNG